MCGRVFLASTTGLLCLAAGLAWAQVPPAAPLQAPGMGPPPTAESLAQDVVVMAPGRAPVVRPRMSLAIGMGATFDDVGFSDGRHAIPSFFAVGGVGDGLFGLDFGAFSSAASGRLRQANPVDRVGLDAFAVIRPAARFPPANYALRVLRTLGAELGLGIERAGRSMIAGNRVAVHTGARVEFPLTPMVEPSQLRLRLAVRRDFGLNTTTLVGRAPNDVTVVDDTALELYAALAVVF
jgi:hypothetical protein